MPSESLKDQHKSIAASVTEYEQSTADLIDLHWFRSDMCDEQTSGHHKPMRYPEILKHVPDDSNEYLSPRIQKQASVKFDLTPITQGLNIAAAFSVYTNKVDASPRSIVAAVELLVNIVGENKHQSITSLTADDYQRLTDAQDKAQEKLIGVVSEDENLLLTSLISLIDNLIRICGDESNPSTDFLPQETNGRENSNPVTFKPHRPEKVGRPVTLPRLKLADQLSQGTNDPEHTDAALLKPHRPEKVGRPATLPRLKLTDSTIARNQGP